MRNSKKIMVYDVEVLRSPDELATGWSDPWAMGFGTGVVYDYSTGFYYFYSEERREELVETLVGATLVVGFNQIKFDNYVIIPNNQCKNFWKNYDILLEVVKSQFGVASIQEAEQKFGQQEVHDGHLGLDAISKMTIGMGKTGHGAHAPQLMREARWAEVYAYNLNDVRLTRKLFDFICQYGYVVDGKGQVIYLTAPTV